MRHWSVDTRDMRENKNAYAVWKLEQAVNFGLRGGKISRKELVKHWDKLDIDPAKKRFLSLILAR